MSDLIDRQAAIDAIEKHLNGVFDGTHYDEGIAYGYEAAHRHIQDVINALPSAQQWIPVTERLPEVDENVLVSYHLHGESEFFPSHNGVTISYWTGVKNHNIPYFGDLGDASTVLAWMPLPEPYRKETEDAVH